MSSPDKETIESSSPSPTVVTNNVTTPLNLTTEEEIIEYYEVMDFQGSKVTHKPFENNFIFGFSTASTLFDTNVMTITGSVGGAVDGAFQEINLPYKL